MMQNLVPTLRASWTRCRHAATAGAVALMASPAFADDPTNISNGLNSITTWVKSAAVPLGVLAVMATGAAKLTGRLDWPRFFSVLVGIGIIFGASQIVGWLSGGATGF